MTPEQCSAEILRVLFGYPPEGVRNDENTGTVITVPAAFNQMQKNATMSAAEMASIGRVALMQEPVAAVMSLMRRRKSDGIFIIYDLGGGTLDVAVAESTSGRVNLLAHGGISGRCSRPARSSSSPPPISQTAKRQRSAAGVLRRSASTR